MVLNSSWVNFLDDENWKIAGVEYLETEEGGQNQ